MASVISIISDIRKMLETMEVQLKNGEHVGDIIASIKKYNAYLGKTMHGY